jgi:hypothetical protein
VSVEAMSDQETRLLAETMIDLLARHIAKRKE